MSPAISSSSNLSDIWRSNANVYFYPVLGTERLSVFNRQSDAHRRSAPDRSGLRLRPAVLPYTSISDRLCATVWRVEVRVDSTTMLRAFCDAVECRDGGSVAGLFSEDGIYHDAFYGA